MLAGKTVGVVVPAYNEGAFVGRVIDTFPSFVDRAYVVDDCSTDETWVEMLGHAATANRAIDAQPPLVGVVGDGGVSFEPVVTKLKVPWDFAFASNGDLFVTERVGRILRVEGGVADVLAEPEAVVDASAIDPGDEGGWWSTGGEDGLLGVAVHPAYPDEPWVYAYYTYRDSEAPEGQYNRVVRYDVTAEGITGTEEVVVDGIPANQFHNGGRLAFGPRDYLWVTCGDGGQPEKADDPSFLGGKVLRVLPDGEPVPENPDWDGGDRRVFTVGHRNPQG